MYIDDLIAQLQQVRGAHGNIPVYSYFYDDEGYPELLKYDKNDIRTRQVCFINHELTYYDEDLEDEAVRVVQTIEEKSFFGPPKETADQHIGLIL